MTYGPGERLPDLHLDPPDFRDCQHKSVEAQWWCPACGLTANFWCTDCLCWIDGECACPGEDEA